MRFVSFGDAAEAPERDGDKLNGDAEGVEEDSRTAMKLYHRYMWMEEENRYESAEISGYAHNDRNCNVAMGGSCGDTVDSFAILCLYRFIGRCMPG